jgi:hypothetical protein
MFFGAAVLAMTLVAASASQAATVYDLIDQGLLNANGTEDFGANIDSTGVFDHTFSFTTAGGDNDASGSVITIRSGNGAKDLDFTAIDLDGVAFVPNFGAPGHEPNESWSLFTSLLGPGAHAIHVHGNVFATGTGINAASYGGTLNLTPAGGGGGEGGGVPEPASWAMMILGFGGVGALMRRRKGLAAV